MSDLIFASATRLRDRIRDRGISSREVVDAYLERIEAVNPKLNAVVALRADEARMEADAADRALARDEVAGPLHGVPMTIKDSFDTAGLVSTWGTPGRAGHVPREDATVVARLRAAGAILLGKTNMPEFGLGSQTYNEVFGETLNPYDTTRTCGGSSGGAAVALACGMIPIADGGDMGGSLRNPASFCNVVGFRPSPGRVPSWPARSAWQPFAVDGPMARTVDDAALLLSAMAGPDPRSRQARRTPRVVPHTKAMLGTRPRTTRARPSSRRWGARTGRKQP